MAGNPKTVRLTLGQAIIQYLQVQYSERDGEEHWDPGPTRSRISLREALPLSASARTARSPATA